MVDKNLFPYDLAVVAIFKDESPYFREWLDYHLLAGVEHFYLYNNGSTDNYAEVLKPYVDAGIVTLIDWPGTTMQMPVYNDALERFRFFCRYMAFIDLDEFIFPKTGQSIVELVDEIFSSDSTAATLRINWQYFGSNGHETADLSRGVLERFTRRAPTDWVIWAQDENDFTKGNVYTKSIVNPRRTDYFVNAHLAIYLKGFKPINSNGEKINREGNYPVTADKIVINHYYTKSREEYSWKITRSDVCFQVNPKNMSRFILHDRNEVFDDGILTYRASRAQSFQLTDEAHRFARVEKVLIDTLTAQSPFDAPAEFFTGKIETFLTCHKLAEVLDVRIGDRAAEEFALVWLYQTLNLSPKITYAEFQLFLKVLPEILSRPSALTKKIFQLTCDVLIPAFCKVMKEQSHWEARNHLLELQKFLRLIK